MISKSEIEPLLATYERIKEIYDKKEKPEPYVIKKLEHGQSLVFIGLQHTYDVNHPQYEIIKREWSKYLKNTKESDRLVLVESGGWPLADSETKAIKESGESGLMIFLGDQEDIKVISPEPPRLEEANYLAKEFNRETVMLHYFVRQIPQWYRTVERPDIKQYMTNVLEHYKKQLGWEFNFSYDNMLKIYKKEFGKDLDPENNKENSKLADPTVETTVTNRVSRACSRHRDLHIAQQISGYWSEGKSLFITYGSAHAYSLEPFLDTL